MSNVKNLISVCINCYGEKDVFTIGIGLAIMIKKFYHYRTIRRR